MQTSIKQHPLFLAGMTGVLAVVATLSSLTAPAGATPPSPTSTFSPSNDGYTSSSAPTASYGHTTDLRLSGVKTSIKVTYLSFALPAYAKGAVVKAVLTLTRTNHHLPSTTISAYGASGSWHESTLTARAHPTKEKLVSQAKVSSTSSTVRLNVTALAQGGSFSTELTSSAPTGIAMFSSRESKTGRPVLTVTLKSPSPPACTVSAKLVSSCQVWLGDAPQAYGAGATSTKLSTDEGYSGRKMNIVHEYNTNGKLFPSADAIALAKGGRLLLENWKPSTSLTWAQVAKGEADSTIDAEAAYLKSNWTEPFFLTIYHEPEDNVNLTANSGMTPIDYVAMYRHTVLRLRAEGVSNAVTVMNYMGYSRWDSLRNSLYPGDDVVDWIAWDPYQANPGNTATTDFAATVNVPSGNYPGFYDWATQAHPSKPLMLAEWGAYDDKLSTNPTGPAEFYGTVAPELARFPALHALVYFTMNPKDVAAGHGTQPTETVAGLAAWQQMVRSAPFVMP